MLPTCALCYFAGVMHSVSAIIHDASDAAVMSTPDTLPGVIDTVRSIFPSKEYWLGPCTIATRGTPYGDSSLGGAVTKALDVNGLKRTPLATNDPRQRGCFGAAYTLALIAKVLTRGAKCMGLGDIVGDRGIMALELYCDPNPHVCIGCTRCGCPCSVMVAMVMCVCCTSPLDSMFGGVVVDPRMVHLP